MSSKTSPSVDLVSKELQSSIALHVILVIICKWNETATPCMVPTTKTDSIEV